MIAIGKNKGREVEPNYRVFFVLGVTWLPLGIATDNSTFLILGFVFMIVGLTNRSKWKDEPKWSDLSAERKKIKLALIVALTILLLAGVAFFALAK